MLFAGAMVALVYPLIEGRDVGWPAWAWGLIALSVILLAADPGSGVGVRDVRSGELALAANPELHGRPPRGAS